MALNTYGLTPLPWWKLFEVDGWQVCVTLEPSETDEDRYGVRIATAIEELGEVQSVFMSGAGREWAEEAFAAMTDGRKTLQVLLDQIGPLLQDMVKDQAHD